jgi:hypothetical protein
MVLIASLIQPGFGTHNGAPLLLSDDSTGNPKWPVDLNGDLVLVISPPPPGLWASHSEGPRSNFHELNERLRYGTRLGSACDEPWPDDQFVILPEARSCLLATLQPLMHRLANSLADGLRKHRVNVSGNRPE